MLLEISELTKTYRGGRRANDGISLDVAEGEVVGLLGHNGAGKTTMVNQVIGLLRPDSGTIHLDGRDAVAEPSLARRLTAVQPQAQVPISGLTPRQAVHLVGRLRGGRADDVRQRTDRLADSLDIGQWMDTMGDRLSGGIKRLTSFCMAAVTPGRLVILDEPTNDVDPMRRRLLWEQVAALADEGVSVLLVTHNVVEAERAVDRLAVLDRGRVIASGTPAALKSAVADEMRLVLTLEQGSSLSELPAFMRQTLASGSRIIGTVAAADAGESVRWAETLRRAGRIEEFGLAPANLEDIYIGLVDGSDDDDAEVAAKEAGDASAA